MGFPGAGFPGKGEEDRSGVEVSVQLVLWLLLPRLRLIKRGNVGCAFPSLRWWRAQLVPVYRALHGLQLGAR